MDASVDPADTSVNSEGHVKPRHHAHTSVYEIGALFTIPFVVMWKSQHAHISDQTFR